MKPFKDVQFISKSRRTIILAAGIHGVFRGIKFEFNAELVQKGTFLKGLNNRLKIRQDFAEILDNILHVMLLLRKHQNTAKNHILNSNINWLRSFQPVTERAEL